MIHPCLKAYNDEGKNIRGRHLSTTKATFCVQEEEEGVMMYLSSCCSGIPRAVDAGVRLYKWAVALWYYIRVRTYMSVVKLYYCRTMPAFVP